MPNDLMEAIVSLVVAIIGVATLVITAVVVPWLRSQLGETRFKQAQAAAEVAVNATEQVIGAGDGMAKRMLAEKQLRALAMRSGIKLTDEQIDTLLEAAVLGLRKVDVSIDAPPVPVKATVKAKAPPKPRTRKPAPRTNTPRVVTSEQMGR